jgi:hypothetical protein
VEDFYAVAVNLWQIYIRKLLIIFDHKKSGSLLLDGQFLLILEELNGIFLSSELFDSCLALFAAFATIGGGTVQAAGIDTE